MNRFISLLAAALLAGFSVSVVRADSLVVQTCGTLPLAYQPGAVRAETIDVNGNRCGSTAGAPASTVNQGTAGASPWATNLTQFGGNNVVTGTGLSGLGIPRMTVSSDSSISINAALPAGANAIGSVSSGQFNTVLPTLTTGQIAYPQVDVNGRLLLSPGQLVAGGQYTSTLPTEVNGQINYLQTDINGRLLIAPNTPSTAQNVTPLPNFDTSALITHTAASVGVNGTDQPNTSGRSINVVVNVTAITGTTPSLTVTLQGKDIASGVYYNILASAAITAVGTTVLTVFPGATAAANSAANAILPRTWRVISTIAGTTPAVTATVGASVIE